jgi:hypothetical protein
MHCERVNAILSRAEGMRRWCALPHDYPDGQLTPMLKIKRTWSSSVARISSTSTKCQRLA